MKSLRSKLIVWYSAVVLLTVAAVLILGRVLLQYEMVSGLDLLNEAEFQEMKPLLQQSSPTEPFLLDPEVADHVRIDAYLFYFQIHHPEQGILFSSPNMGEQRFALVDSPVPRTEQLEEIGAVRVRTFPFGPVHVQIGASMEQVNELLRAYWPLAFALFAGSLLASILIGIFLSRLALGPIQSIQRTAERISLNNLSERIETTGSQDELAALSQLLNRMFARLERSFEQVQQFTADASHELRTPLALVRLHTEKLLQNQELPPATKDSLNEQLEAIARLNTIIDNLLVLAKADSGGIQIKREKQPVERWLDALAEDAAALCEDANLHFERSGEVPAEAVFDPAWLQHAALNLLSNALKAAPSGSTIRLKTGLAEQTWFFVIEDEGKGVPEAELERIFHRFHRLDQEKAGTGLGLAICRSIVQLHGGKVMAQNRHNNEGLQVKIELPLVQPS